MNTDRTIKHPTAPDRAERLGMRLQAQRAAAIPRHGKRQPAAACLRATHRQALQNAGALNCTNGLLFLNCSYRLTFLFFKNAIGGSPVGITSVTGVAVEGGAAPTAILVQAETPCLCGPSIHSPFSTKWTNQTQ